MYCVLILQHHFKCLEPHKIPRFSKIELRLHLENQRVLLGNIF